MPSAAAQRQRRWRARQRTGGAVLQVAIADYYALVGVLIDSDWISAEQALDRGEVEKAVAAALDELAQWGRRKTNVTRLLAGNVGPCKSNT